jgi:hypothetical protein
VPRAHCFTTSIIYDNEDLYGIKRIWSVLKFRF